jgi:CAAX prenyl protease-like protein
MDHVSKQQSGSAPGVLAHPTLAYTAPFVVLLALMAISPHLPVHNRWEYPLRVIIVGITIILCSRRVLDFRVRKLLGTAAVGAAVFAIWIAPDVLIPGYRSSVLFQNSITGTLQSSTPGDMRDDLLVLIFRAFRAIVIVAIVEELFWRGWLLRWLIDQRFWDVPLGTYTASSMWITAALFASEHGPYWDVGLVAGLIYNWWMIRTKSLGDCILAHAITNGLLSGYVLYSGRWEYWF